MDGKREIKMIVQALQEAGWTCVIGGSGHWKAYPPDASLGMEVLGNSISDTRALDNIKARLKRKGFDYDRRNEYRPKELLQPAPSDIVEIKEQITRTSYLKVDPNEMYRHENATLSSVIPGLSSFINKLPDGGYIVSLYLTNVLQLGKLKHLLSLDKFDNEPAVVVKEKYASVLGAKKFSGSKTKTCSYCGALIETKLFRPSKIGKETCSDKECISKYRHDLYEARKLDLNTDS